MADKVCIGTAIEVNYADTGTSFASHISKPSDNCTFKELIAPHFSDITEATVLFSGGIDSQFTMGIAQQMGVRVNAITYAGIWENSVVNASDVLTAQRFCAKHDIPIRIIDLDLKQFLNSGELIDFATSYKTFSPQVCCHLKFLSSLDNSTPILMGGDPVTLYSWLTHDGNFYARTSVTMKKQIVGIIAPYYNFADKNNFKLIKDIFYLSPELLYYGLVENINLVKTKNLYINYKISQGNAAPDVEGVDDFMLYKSELYKSFNVPIETQLRKRTGFEDLKIHLAAQTGIYNQFDILYREPIETIFQRYSWSKNYSVISVLDKIILKNPLFVDICEQYIDEIKNSKSLKNLLSYKFDF